MNEWPNAPTPDPARALADEIADGQELTLADVAGRFGVKRITAAARAKIAADLAEAGLTVSPAIADAERDASVAFSRGPKTASPKEKAPAAGAAPETTGAEKVAAALKAAAPKPAAAPAPAASPKPAAAPPPPTAPLPPASSGPRPERLALAGALLIAIVLFLRRRRSG
jgi:hypothetical protein